MVSGTEAITTRALSLALDAAVLRQQVIASNIANANAAGFFPLRVSFNAQFDAVRRSLVDRGGTDRSALGAIQIQIEPALDANGISRPVELDAEVAALAQNTTHYQTLIRGLSRHLSILASAVSEARSRLNQETGSNDNGHQQSFAISAAGMGVERLRVEVARSIWPTLTR